MVKYFIGRIITLNIIFVLMMTIYRIIFIFYYSNLLELLQYLDNLIQAFLLGFRYDFAVLAYINFLVILFFIIFLFIGSQKLFVKFVKSLKYYYTIFLGFIITFLCIDFGFYTYFDGHINYMIFELFNHNISYLWYISKNEHILFFVLFFIIFIFLFFIFYLSKYVLEKNINKYVLSNKIYKKITVSIVALVVVFTFLLNTKNINTTEIYRCFNWSSYRNFFVNIIISNKFFDMIKLLEEYFDKIDCIKKFGYKNNISKAFSDFLDKNETEIYKEVPELSLLKTTEYNEEIEKLQPNVVLIVAEALGMDLMQYNSNDFNIMGDLKKHFDEDIVFYNCLYSYEETATSIDSIILGLLRSPKFIDAFKYFSVLSNHDNLNSIYLTSGIIPYMENNYEVYNCLNNSNFFRVNFQEKKHIEFNDEMILDYIFKVLEKKKNKKNFIYVLTLTNHSPFELPSNYKINDFKIPDNIKQNFFNTKGIYTFQYSCQKLGEFLTKFKNSKYADNTIVAITGDHTSRILYSNNFVTAKSVPFYLYIPEKLMPNKELIDTTRVVCHIDIMPTLYELSLSGTQYYSIGTNVFDKNYQNAISSNYDDAIIVNENDMCTYNVDLEKIIGYKLIKNKNKLVEYKETNLTDKHKKMIKQYKAALAVSQYLKGK